MNVRKITVMARFQMIPALTFHERNRGHLSFRRIKKNLNTKWVGKKHQATFEQPRQVTTELV